MLSAIFKRAKSCKHGKHSLYIHIVYTNIYFIMWILSTRILWVARLEKHCTIKVQHRNMLEKNQKSLRRMVLHVSRWLESSPDSAKSSVTKRIYTTPSPTECSQYVKDGAAYSLTTD